VKTPNDTAGFVAAISAAWTKSVDCIFDAAILCAEADERLTSIERALLIDGLPFAAPTFSKLVKIGNDQRLRKDDVRGLLPASYSIMYAVAQCSDYQLRRIISEGVLHPAATRAEIEAYRKKRVPRALLPLEIDEEKTAAEVVGEPLAETKPKDYCFAEIRVPYCPFEQADELEGELRRLAETFGVELVKKQDPLERAERLYGERHRRFYDRWEHYGRVLTRKRIKRMKEQTRRDNKKWGYLWDETNLGDPREGWPRILEVLTTLGIEGDYEDIRAEAKRLAKPPTFPTVPQFLEPRADDNWLDDCRPPSRAKRELDAAEAVATPASAEASWRQQVDEELEQAFAEVMDGS